MNENPLIGLPVGGSFRIRSVLEEKEIADSLVAYEEENSPDGEDRKAYKVEFIPVKMMGLNGDVWPWTYEITRTK